MWSQKVKGIVSNGNEEVFNMPQISRTGTSPSDVVWHTQDSPVLGGRGLTPLQGI